MVATPLMVRMLWRLVRVVQSALEDHRAKDKFVVEQLRQIITGPPERVR